MLSFVNSSTRQMLACPGRFVRSCRYLSLPVEMRRPPRETMPHQTLNRPTIILALVTAMLSVAAAAASAQVEVTRVELIRAQPDQHLNEIRTIEGAVDRLVGRTEGATPAFYLEDDFGHQLLVIPMGAPPVRGARVMATGVVSLDPTGDPILTVFTEDGIATSAEDGPVEPADPEVAVVPQLEPLPPSPPEDGWPWKIIGGVLAGLALLGYAYQRGRASVPPGIITGDRPANPKKEVDIAVSALWPESDQEFDGRTMRFIRPDPTVQLLPARLEVIGGGDTGEEIRFIGVPGEPAEMMFGRSGGEGPTYIQLKQKTVSRTHAVVRYRHGEWLIENLSMTNPTRLNGEELGVKERLLTEGDRIEMGEVMLCFRE